MKVLAIVALFAFVAVQLSQSAPAEEEKKDPAMAPAAAAVSGQSSHAVAEAKAGMPESVTSEVDAATHGEEKRA